MAWEENDRQVLERIAAALEKQNELEERRQSQSLVIGKQAPFSFSFRTAPSEPFAAGATAHTCTAFLTTYGPTSSCTVCGKTFGA